MLARAGDRVLVAQALRADLELVSIERLFDDYGVRRRAPPGQNRTRIPTVPY